MLLLKATQSVCVPMYLQLACSIRLRHLRNERQNRELDQGPGAEKYQPCREERLMATQPRN